MILELAVPLDPLHGDGYQFWSGIGGFLVLVGGLWAWLRKHNCHVHRCWRIGRHAVTGTEYVVCRKHHPHDHITAGQVLSEHEASGA